MEARHIRWILREAKRRGLVVRKAPAHYAKPGKRIGGSKRTHGPDKWMNAMNVKLWLWQKGEVGDDKGTT
jgi:hypothetical protein